ncbi:hypothetical protein ACSBR1_016062 [Camellia fascicularis]
MGSSVKRVQDPTRGKNTSTLITQHGSNKLFVGVSSERRTFVRLNATKIANELGAQIILQAPLQGKKIERMLHQPFEQLSYNPCTDPYSKPFVGVSQEDWRYMIDHVFFGDPQKEASQPGATPMTQEQISIQVLGKRSVYLKGFGVGPKLSSAFNSIARSQSYDEEVKGLKEEVASLKGITQSYEGRFEQFEHFIRQMQGDHSAYDSFDE